MSHHTRIHGHACRLYSWHCKLKRDGRSRCCALSSHWWNQFKITVEVINTFCFVSFFAAFCFSFAIPIRFRVHCCFCWEHIVFFALSLSSSLRSHSCNGNSENISTSVELHINKLHPIRAHSRIFNFSSSIFVVFALPALQNRLVFRCTNYDVN